MMLLTREASLARALDHIVRHALGHPHATSDHLLSMAEAHTEAALDDRIPAAERQLWHDSADRLRSAAPIYVARSIRPGCPAGLGGE